MVPGKFLSQSSPYANVVKEWFKLPGGRLLTRQDFPAVLYASRKSQKNQGFFAGMTAALFMATDQKGSVANG